MSQNNELNTNPLFENLKNAEWITIYEAAKIFPIKLSAFHKHKKNGIPVRKILGKLVVKKSEVTEWLERWAA